MKYRYCLVQGVTLRWSFIYTPSTSQSNKSSISTFVIVRLRFLSKHTLSIKPAVTDTASPISVRPNGTPRSRCNHSTLFEAIEIDVLDSCLAQSRCKILSPEGRIRGMTICDGASPEDRIEAVNKELSMA